MRRLSFLAVFLLLLSCARGPGVKPNPRSPQEMQRATLAQQISDESEILVREAPPELSPNVAGFSENAASFNNASQRFGPDSLEARNAFDKLFYQANQLDRIMTPQNYPKMMADWQKIRADINTMAKQLGYKVKG